MSTCNLYEAHVSIQGVAETSRRNRPQQVRTWTRSPQRTHMSRSRAGPRPAWPAPNLDNYIRLRQTLFKAELREAASRSSIILS